LSSETGASVGRKLEFSAIEISAGRTLAQRLAQTLGRTVGKAMTY